MSKQPLLLESSTHAAMIRKNTIFPILVVGLLLVTTRGNWKLLEHATSSSTRELMAEESSFMPSWKFYNHSVFEHHHHQQQQQQSSITVNNSTFDVSKNSASIETNFTRYYFLHIPKAGGNSMRDALIRKGACVIDNGPKQHIRNFANWTLEHPHHRVFMSEGLGFNEESPPPSMHNFVMFRDPQSHVLSQYFHCTESRGTQTMKARLNRMPKTLHEWLQIWEETRRSKSLARRKLTHHAHRRWTDPRMRCYNPIDFQSWLTGYPHSKQELEERFDAIGILSEFHLSSCVFSTMILNRVPKVCNCSSHSIIRSNGNDHSTTTSNAGSNDDDSNINDGTQKTHNGQSHGVTHHGDSYQPSDEELKLIRNLTMHDQILYDNAKEIFYAKVADLERQYQVTFCSSAPAKQKRRGGRGCNPALN